MYQNIRFLQRSVTRIVVGNIMDYENSLRIENNNFNENIL
jgi:hypothetical protein